MRSHAKWRCEEICSRKSSREIIREDKGLYGELDRLPMLTWIMFLKFLDDRVRKKTSDGESQFTLPDVLKVPPISRHGNVGEIIGKLGGADQLCNAMNQLQTLLYAA